MKVPALLLSLVLLSSCWAYAENDKARFTKEGDLVTPANYREWIFLSSGLGMTYGPNAPAAGTPMRFDNVFVNRSSYRQFVETGKWVDGTVLILEVRNSESKGSINQHGSFQSNIAGVEAHVKDSRRFRSGWAFYELEASKSTAKAIAPGNRCEQCHEANGSVDTTFVQFYPDLIPIARKFGQIKTSTAKPSAPESTATTGQ